MKRFPSYEREVNIDTKQMRLKVEVRAGTKCGPDVSGEHIVRLLTTKLPETRLATVVATSFAVSKMKKEHDDIVRKCERNGTHNH